MFLEDVYKEFLLGLDVYSLSRLLGHESTVVTSRYITIIKWWKHCKFGKFNKSLNEYREKSKIKEENSEVVYWNYTKRYEKTGVIPRTSNNYLDY